MLSNWHQWYRLSTCPLCLILSVNFDNLIFYHYFWDSHSKDNNIPYKSEDEIKSHILRKKICVLGFSTKIPWFLYIVFFLHSPFSWWLMTCLLQLTIAYHHRPLYCFFFSRNRNWHQRLCHFVSLFFSFCLGFAIRYTCPENHSKKICAFSA